MLTNLEGRVKNTSLPNCRGLLPLFEAVVNAIHAIESKLVRSENDKIEITILRDKEEEEYIDSKPGKPALGKITGFIIQDQGVGFDDENYKAFQELDTPHKQELGGRGIGRLMWLKAFDKIDIESIYEEQGRKFRRSFSFNVKEGVIENPPCEVNYSANTGSTIKLIGFLEKYRNNVHKSGELIARDILEHCMWYFLRDGGAPRIELMDGNDSIIRLDDVYEQSISRDANEATFRIKGVEFKVIHLKLRNDIGGDACVAYCANNRVVKTQQFSGGYEWLGRKMSDSDGVFVYRGYVTSSFLDERVRADRLGFDLEGDAGALFETVFISEDDIISKLGIIVSEYLADEKAKLMTAGYHRVRNFVENKAPRYRAILTDMEEEMVNPDSSDKDLELQLHKKYAEVEADLIKKGQNISSEIENLSSDEGKQRLQEFLGKLEQVKSSELSAYVFYRKYALDLLKKLLKMRADGKHEKEENIHKLIFPMRVTSDSCKIHTSNLWIIDERLAFHHFLASDLPLSSLPISDTSSRLEPDLVSLKVMEQDFVSTAQIADTPLLVSDADRHNGSYASLAVVEFKRPMRNDMSSEDKDPIKQVLDYFQKLKDGNVYDVYHRPIDINNVPLYGYIIADLTKRMREWCDYAELTETPDHGGYYGYKKKHGVYIEVISYDKLVKAAYERNAAFFEKLGLGYTCLL